MFKISMPLSYERLYSGSLDSTSVFNNYNDLLEYSTSPTAYGGQLVACLKTDEIAYDVFVINEDRTLRKVGSGDGGGDGGGAVEIDVTDSDTIALVLDVNNFLKASLKISSEPNNAILTKSDGIFIEDTSDLVAEIDGKLQEKMNIVDYVGDNAADSVESSNTVVNQSTFSDYLRFKVVSKTTYDTLDLSDNLDSDTIYLINENNKLYTTINSIKWNQVSDKPQSTQNEIDMSVLSSATNTTNLTNHIDNAQVHLSTQEKNGLVLLNGLTGNIQEQINMLSNVSKIKGIVETHADLEIMTGLVDGDVIIVRNDEVLGVENAMIIYLDGVFSFLNRLDIEMRDFTIEPIDLSNEIIGVLADNHLSVTLRNKINNSTQVERSLIVGNIRIDGVEIPVFEDVPNDSKEYIRKDGNWYELTQSASGGGVIEAPITGKVYGRSNGSWIEIQRTPSQIIWYPNVSENGNVSWSLSDVDDPPITRNIKGNKGNDGLSAYEIAINNNFVGTERQWLESLIGKNGLSAYEQAVLNGFVGSIEAWLSSLVGQRGATGIQGPPGKDSDSNIAWYPLINEYGDLTWVRTSTEMPPEPINIKGDTGVIVPTDGMFAMNIDENGHLIITTSPSGSNPFTINEDGNLIMTV